MKAQKSGGGGWGAELRGKSVKYVKFKKPNSNLKHSNKNWIQKIAYNYKNLSL